VSLFARVCLGLIWLYQHVWSPHAAGACRHVPSCSNYGAEAIRRHGAMRGLWLIARRLARCHPLGSSGYDPVP